MTEVMSDDVVQLVKLDCLHQNITQAKSVFWKSWLENSLHLV